MKQLTTSLILAAVFIFSNCTANHNPSFDNGDDTPGDTIINTDTTVIDSSIVDDPISTAKTNVIYINVDDMGWMDLAFQGSEYYETPNIDAFATQSIIFTNGYAAAANCAPSRACLMSGQNTPRHGIYTVDNSDRGNAKTRQIVPTPNTTVLRDDIVTMAEMFKQEGYATISLGKWHLGADSRTQGFDVNIGGDHRGNPGKNGYFSPYNIDFIEDNNPGENLTDRLTQEACSFIEDNKDTTFFVYLSFYAVHTPLATTSELLAKYKAKTPGKGQDNANFAGMVETVDNNVGRLVSTLEELELTDNTLIVFTSDNGGIRDVSFQDPLRAGKGSYYEGGIRVPLCVKWPEHITSKRLCDVPVVNMDFFPTFRDVIEADLGAKALDGRSLLPYLKNNETLEEKPLFWHFPIYLQAYKKGVDDGRDVLFRTRPGSAMRYGKWKLHEYFEDGAIELYNLEEDLNERTNLADTETAKRDELYQMLLDWRAGISAPVPTERNPKYDAAYEQELIDKVQ